MSRSTGLLVCLLPVVFAPGCDFGRGDSDESPRPDPPRVADQRFVRLPPVKSEDPAPETSDVVRLAPIPWTVVRACRRFQKDVGVPMLCPARLPRALLHSFPGYLPQVLGSERNGPSELHIGYGAETPPGELGHRWRNRPCCFLHFVIGKRDQPLPAEARPRVLGGIEGRFLRATGQYFESPYFGNHERFFFRRGAVEYVATLHTFGNRQTARLLGKILTELRPVDQLRIQPEAVARTIRTGGVGTIAVAAGAGALWAANAGDLLHGFTTPTPLTPPSLARIDTETGDVARIRRLGQPRGLAVGAGGVWLAGYRGNTGVVTRIDPQRNRVVEVIRRIGKWPRAIAADASGVWVVNSAPFFKRGTLVRIDPATSRVSGPPIPLGRAPAEVVLGAGSVWIADAMDNSLTRIAGETGKKQASVPVGRRPYGLAFGAGSVWVTNTDDSTVSRIDTGSDEVVATIRVGLAPHGIAFGHGGVWVANLGDGTVARIDPATNRVVQSVYLGGEPLAVVADEKAVWVTRNSEGTVTRLG